MKYGEKQLCKGLGINKHSMFFDKTAPDVRATQMRKRTKHVFTCDVPIMQRIDAMIIKYISVGIFTHEMYKYANVRRNTTIQYVALVASQAGEIEVETTDMSGRS